MYLPGLPNPFLALQGYEPKSLDFKISILLLVSPSITNNSRITLPYGFEYKGITLAIIKFKRLFRSVFTYLIYIYADHSFTFCFPLDLFNLVKTSMTFPIITVIVSWVINADPRNSACSDGFREVITRKTHCLSLSCFQSCGWGSLVQVQSQTQMITR